MNELLKKDVNWVWGPRQAAAYETLKRLMTEPGRVLRPVDPDKPLILHTDWSIHGIGAVLGQLDDDGNEYLVHASHAHLTSMKRITLVTKGNCLLWRGLYACTVNIYLVLSS